MFCRSHAKVTSNPGYPANGFRAAVAWESAPTDGAFLSGYGKAGSKFPAGILYGRLAYCCG